MNKFMVGMQGEDVVILVFGRKVLKEDAINLAAWLVALADPDAGDILADMTGHEKEHRTAGQPTAFQKALSEALS